MTPPRAAALLLAATLAACGGGGDGGTNPPPTPTIAIAVAPASLNITASSNDQAGITLTRGGGYTGAVSLALEGVPAGVTGTFNPASIATGGTSSTLSLAVGASTAAGTYTMTVRATGSGVTAATATLNLTVAPAPSFNLTLAPAALNIAQGASGNTTVNINRTNYLGPVNFTLEGAPVGITGSFNPNPSQANSTALTVSVANTVAAGNYTMTVRGTSAVLPAQTAQLTVTVLAPAGSFTLTMTPATLNITQGQTGNATININRTGGFAANVTLSLEGAPVGVTSSFTPNPAGGASSAMAVTVGAAVAPGNYNLTLRGTTPNPSPDGSLTPAAVAQMAPDQTLSITISIAVAGSYSLSATAATSAQGATGTSTITLTRTGGNTSSVALALEGAPAGVTSAFAPNPAAGGTSTLTLTVGGSVAVGNYNLTVRGTAAGLADQTTTFQLSVTAPAGFTLSANPATLNIAQGANTNSTININRTGGFSASVALTHTTTAPAGVTVAFNPAATTGSTSTMTVTVGGGVTPGNYTITVKGNATGQAEQTTIVNLSVQAGGSGSVTWTFCAQTGQPFWAAYQNGTGGTWTQSVGAGGTYSFNITDTKGAIAWVQERENSTEAELMIVYGSVQELQANAPDCVGSGASKTVNATMSNLQASQSSMVTLGSGSTAVSLANQANFAIPGVNDGTVDLFATNYTQLFVPPFGQTLNGLIIRRGLNPAANSTITPTLDWNGGEKITPITKTVTVTNGAGQLQSIVTYLTANGTGALLGTVGGGSPYTFYAVPDASRVAGDLHILTVSTALQNGYAYQTVSKIFAAAADQTVTLGSGPPVGGFTLASTTPYSRPRTQFTNTAEYNRLIMMIWNDQIPIPAPPSTITEVTTTVTFWEGYGLGLAVDYTLPDFSSVAGWNNRWGMVGGLGRSGFIVTGWTTGGGVGQPPQADGTTSVTAGRWVDTINP